ncbi:MAG: DUF2059 domain-containing protein [Pseudolabrys sp.]|nr:DUF2059 domain-containing protein [Pseudolabrys sp.]
MAQQPAPTPAALAAAKEVVAITGATALFNPLIAGVVEQAKNLFLQQNPALAKDLNEVAVKLRTDLAPRFDEISNEVARIYTVHFAEAELKELAAFYKTPVGKKLIEVQSLVVDDSLKFAQDWANKLSDEVLPKIRDEMKKRGHSL